MNIHKYGPHDDRTVNHNGKETNKLARTAYKFMTMNQLFLKPDTQYIDPIFGQCNVLFGRQLAQFAQDRTQQTVHVRTSRYLRYNGLMHS
jgi:hypothetical protein